MVSVQRKETGIPWIGSIPEHWGVKRFKFCYIRSNAGEVIDKGHWHHGDELLFTCQRTAMQSSFAMFPDQKRTSVRDLLLTRNGTPYVHLPPEGAIYSNVVQRVRLLSDLNRDYAHYMLGVAASNLRGYGDIIESFNMRTWDELAFVTPPRGEQDRIVAFLDAKTAEIEAAIAKKQRLIELLHEQKAILINQAVTQGLNPNVEMKDSGCRYFPEIPTGWSIVRFKNVTTGFEQGWSPQCFNWPAPESAIGVLKVGCVNGYVFDGTENKELPPELAPKLQYLVKKGDILISRANTIELVGGAACIKTTPVQSLIVCDKLYRTRAYDDVSMEYLISVIQSRGAREQIEIGANGASPSMKNIGQDVIRNLVIPWPSKDEQAHINQKVSEICLYVVGAEEQVFKEVELLKDLKSTLIANAVLGQLELSE